VRRAGNKVRVTAQLIDARTDTHRWADQYDGDLSDVFAIQSKMARQIADQLDSKLSPAERAGIAERPTDDLEAYRLYTEANAIFVWDDVQNSEKSITRKVELLEEATQRDPRFALAYCALAKTQNDFLEESGDQMHFDLARKAAETAWQLRPDLGETHRALAVCYLHDNDFDHAHAEIAVALRTLPNDAEAFRIAALIDERLNRWSDAVTELQQAYKLDPANEEVGYYLGKVYRFTRHYREWEELLDKRVARNEQEHYWIQIGRAQVRLAQGDPAAAQALLDKIPLDFNPTDEICWTRYKTALFLRDYPAAARIIAATPQAFAAALYNGTPPQSEADGFLARLRGDESKALAVFAAARQQIETDWSNRKKEADYFDAIASLDALLGRKEQAVREARQLVELEPISKNAVDGPAYATRLPVVYAWTGEPDLAIEQLSVLARIPAGPEYGDLRFNPRWDPLRGNPRFEALIAEVKPSSP
jgi:tetratricopeptide (TPR) repeat protein